MFDNRAYGWKLGGALALVLAACAWADRRGDEINPAYWRCRLQPERFDGVVVRYTGVAIQNPDAEGFFITQDYFRIRVRGALPEGLRGGDVVGLRARFRKDFSLEALQIQKQRSHLRVRFWMNLASMAVLAGVIAMFLLAFRIRWDRLAARTVVRPRSPQDG